MLERASSLPLRRSGLRSSADGFHDVGFWSFRRLFLRYAAGDVFSNETLRSCTNVAVALFAQVIVDLQCRLRSRFCSPSRWVRTSRHLAALGSDDVFSLFWLAWCW